MPKKTPTKPQSNKITSYFSPTKKLFDFSKVESVEDRENSPPSMENGNSVVPGAWNLHRYSVINTQNSGEASHPSNIIKSPPRKKEAVANSGLKKCFTALVERKQVNLELEVLQLMLRKEMQVPLETLDPELASILPYLLVYYIRTWPGWQRANEYYERNITFRDWYEKFNKFIMLKLSYAVNDSFKEAKQELALETATKAKEMHQNGAKLDRNTQTDNLAPKGVAPFTIEISAPPVWLNSIVFSENSEGSVILKQHSLGIVWDASLLDSITLKQIITWPHVSVHFLSNVLNFSRLNIPHYERQISIATNAFPASNRQHVEEIKTLMGTGTKERDVFTVNYVKWLCNQLLDVINNEKDKVIYESFKTVLYEFIQDLEEINVCVGNSVTVATNTSVTFNIGRQTYFRNKKLSRGAPTRFDVSYMELMIPRVQLVVQRIGNLEEIEEYLKYVKNDKNQTSNLFPEIRFSCNYCNIDYKQVNALLSHIRDIHKMEQEVLCMVCKRKFQAPFLTDKRYTHTCLGRK